MSDFSAVTKIPAAGERRRNTEDLIKRAWPHFRSAHLEGLMAVYGRPLSGRAVELHTAGNGRLQIVDFVRCSYLGLDNHPAIIAGAISAVESYGTLHWSCARTRLNFTLIGELEEALSDLFAASVITYSSVLAANMGALPLLASGHLTNGKKPLMVFDRLAHATLAFHKATIGEETEVITIGHNDMEALETICRRQSSVVYVCDGVYSMGGSAPMSDLISLQERYGLFLYVDDAHGISISGRTGQGHVRAQIPGPLGERTIIAASLGKGFGASGGMIMLGTARQVEVFRNFAVAHAFSASPNVAAIGAALASAALHRTPKLAARQDTLQSRIALFDTLVATEQSGTPLPIRIINIGDELETIGAARAVLDKGFYTSAVFFPTVAKGRAGLRICPTAGHTADDISALCDVLHKTLPERICPL